MAAGDKKFSELPTAPQPPAIQDFLLGITATNNVYRYPLGQARGANIISPQDFGAAGDGVADDTAAFNGFLANLSGRTGLLYGTYKLTALPAVTALSNCRMLGLPGTGATVTGSFGYFLLSLGALTNVSFEDIKFNSTYVNPVLQGGGVVYVFEQNMLNVRFLRCEFTSPNACTGGLSLVARYTGTTATIRDVWIEDCNFHDIGHNGCTIMNRGFAQADKYTAVSQIRFNNNRCSNLGALPGGLANLISLDGVGSDFSCNYNAIAGCVGYFGIENTGFINGTIVGNTALVDASGVFNLEGTCSGIAPDTDNRIMTGLSCVGNIESVPKPDVNFIYFVEDSFFANNQFRSSSRGMSMRGVQRCTFVGEQYVMSGAGGDFAILLEAGTGTPTGGNACTHNRFYACLFDNSVAASIVTILLNGTTTTDNVFDEQCRILPPGGTIKFQQAAGVSGNWFNSKPVQRSDLYNLLVTDASYELGSLNWQSNVFTLETTAAGAGTVRKFQIKQGGTLRFDVGVTRPAGVAFVVSGDLVQSNGAFYMVATALPGLALNSTGSNYGIVSNVNSTTWSLGFNSTPLLLGTHVLSWSDTPGLGFYGTSPIAKPTVTGAKAGNAALTSLMTALANLGLVTNSTT